VTPPPDQGSAPRPVAPTCYRHPQRETHVRCVRCDRPICGECQHAASVGFQCPDDVAEGRRSRRQPRTLAGGRVVPGVGEVTRALVAALVVVFLVQLTLGRVVELRFGMQPLAVAAGEQYRLVTSAFLHGGLLHLAFNATALLSLGPQLEAALGRLRFAGLYGLCAFGGSVASYVFSDPRVLGVGASGAIYGVFGGLLIVARRLRYDVRGLAVLLALNLALGFVVPSIDWRAHLGGLAVGAVLTAALVRAPRDRHRSAVQLTVGAALAVLLLAVAALRTAALVPWA
jgi:membrane associated rhomboid family serine protease